MELAAFFMQPYPGATALDKHILHSHGDRRADPGKGVDHQADQRAIAQAFNRLAIDRVEEETGLFGGEHRRLAFLHRILRASHGTRRIVGNDLADHEPIEQHANGREMLFHGRRGQPALQGFNIGGHMDRLDGL